MVYLGFRKRAARRAEVAQLVEHSTENAGVPSSTLGLGTIFNSARWSLFRFSTSLRARGRSRFFNCARWGPVFPIQTSA
jgi:hypothetical protein